MGKSNGREKEKDREEEKKTPHGRTRNPGKSHGLFYRILWEMFVRRETENQGVCVKLSEISHITLELPLFTDY